MPSTNNERHKRAPLISRVESGGTIIETIFRGDEVRTLLVVARGETIEVCDKWSDGDVTYEPVKPTNNLLKHQALLLPSETADYDSVDCLLSDIRSYIARYVALPEGALDLSVAYVLLSWVYDAFSEVPYLRFRGDYGTGKTRALLVIGSLCYKAFFASGASTVSPIFHTLDSFNGTLIFDEADFRFSDEKAELVKILNNGNVKGFPVLRTQVTPQREFDPRAFAIFGPKIVAMRRSYDDRALESRFLTIEMQPGRPAANVPINLPEEQKEEALQLRNKLLMYRLRNRLSVMLDPSLADSAFEPRLNQILIPILSVVPEDLRATIRAAASTLQAGIISERTDSSEGRLLAVLAPLLHPKLASPLPLSEIAAAFSAEYAKDYERPINNRWIGSVLRRLGIALYKSNGVFVIVPGQDDRLTALNVRYGIAPKGESTASEAS